eukprot:3389215-Amphidinium_carterae.1
MQHAGWSATVLLLMCGFLVMPLAPLPPSLTVCVASLQSTFYLNECTNGGIACSCMWLPSARRPRAKERVRARGTAESWDYSTARFVNILSIGDRCCQAPIGAGEAEATKGRGKGESKAAKGSK